MLALIHISGNPGCEILLPNSSGAIDCGNCPFRVVSAPQRVADTTGQFPFFLSLPAHLIHTHTLGKERMLVVLNSPLAARRETLPGNLTVAGAARLNNYSLAPAGKILAGPGAAAALNQLLVSLLTP